MVGWYKIGGNTYKVLVKYTEIHICIYYIKLFLYNLLLTVINLYFIGLSKEYKDVSSEIFS